MEDFSLREKRAIAWELRSAGVTVKKISEQYGWGMPVIYSWGKNKEGWERRKRQVRNRSRERYHNDPVYRENKLSNQKARNVLHREEINAKARERRQNEPEWRTRVNELARENNRRNAAKIRQRRYDKYHTDPEYRKSMLAKSKKYQEAHPEEHRKRSREWGQKKSRLRFENKDDDNGD